MVHAPGDEAYFVSMHFDAEVGCCGGGPAWAGGQGAVAEAFGTAWAAARDPANAIKWYEKALAANVIRLLRDPAMAAGLAQNAYRESRKYTWEVVRE